MATDASSLPRSALGWGPHLWNRVLFPGEADTRTRVRPLSLLFVLLLPAILLYPTRAFYLLEPDEGRYAQIPKEMVEGGSWVVPTLQGEPYLDKPPLMYWLVAISYEIFGVSEASARLVPALCVHLTILAIYLLGRRSIGERGAFWAALLLTVAPGFLGVARLLLLDGLLTLCVTMSVLCGFEAVRSGTLNRRWWIAAAVMSGLGFLTKGPISEVLLFPPLLLFAWLQSQRSLSPFAPRKDELSPGLPMPELGEVGEPTFRGAKGDHGALGLWKWCKAHAKDAALFAGIVVLVNSPWYVAMLLREPQFLKHFFWEHNVMRFAKPFDHLEPIWYYAPIFLGGFLPGVLLAVPYLRSLLFGGTEEAQGRSAAGGFWLLSGLWCLFFFSLSGSKLPTYILPAFPPLCLALGEFVARSRWDRSLFPRGVVAAFAVLLLAVNFAVLPWYAKVRSPMGRPEMVRRYLNDPNVTVVTYPRNVDSVAFYMDRKDLKAVRSKDVNQMIVDSHFRPKTVILFTHEHSLRGFEETLAGAKGSSLRITETKSFRHNSANWLDKMIGGTPWGLCDIAVVEPSAEYVKDRRAKGIAMRGGD